MLSTIYVDTAEKLAGFLDAGKSESVFSLDTEFLRERTYFPILCLVQLASRETIALVDVPSLDDPQPLWSFLADRELIMHAARQDVEVLLQSSGRLPSALFDTQIAAALAGFPAQLGYAGIVQELFGVKLAKTHTRTDWSRRPLNADELAYAADDVRYLRDARERLREMLAAAGRLDWAREDSMRQLERGLYEVEPDDAWQRVKGLTRLRGAAQSRAKALASWRERTAISKDLPRRWVMKDADLLEIANADAQSVADLADLPLSKGNLKSHGEEICALLAASRDNSEASSTHERPDAEQKELSKKMAELVAARATDLGIEPEVIAPQRELKAAAMGQAGLRIFAGWRNDVIGGELAGMVQ